MQGADVNVKNAEGLTAFQVTASSYPRPRIAIYHLLRSKGALPDLLSAIAVEDLETVKALLAKGTDVNTAAGMASHHQFDATGNNALMEAVRGRHSGIVRLLLERGANPNHADPDGELPLVVAGGSGNLEMVQALLDKGGDVNRGSPFQWQVELPDRSAVKADGSGVNKISVVSVARTVPAMPFYGGGPAVTMKRLPGDGIWVISTLHTTLAAAIRHNDRAMYDLLRRHHAHDTLDVFAAAAIGDIDAIQALRRQGVSFNAMNKTMICR